MTESTARKPKRSNLKPPGRCIFCDRQGNLSKEHLTADWIKNYVPRVHKATERYRTHASASRGSQQFQLDPDSSKTIVPGDPASHRKRVVCVSCNQGWMGKLQETTKKHLVPLIKGDWSEFKDDARSTLASWAVMRTMVIEFTHPKRSCYAT